MILSGQTNELINKFNLRFRQSVVILNVYAFPFLLFNYIQKKIICADIQRVNQLNQYLQAEFCRTVFYPA